jgi:acetoacetate decarboxylase
MKGIPWLAGRGYNTFGLTIPVLWQGQETIAGDFVVVLFENLADPIMSGREELGWNKLWCELPDVERRADAVCCRASWLGFQFATLTICELQPAEAPPAAPGRPRFGYKYIPRSGDWGEPDVSYPTVSPPEPGVTVTERITGRGRVDVANATWEDLPTLFRVVNGLAALPQREIIVASVTRTLGSGDFYELRRLT